MQPFHIVARIHTDFPSKFGVPRQSGIVEEAEGVIVFEPAYRAEGALKGLEEVSHLWLIWLFSENGKEGWSPTVRPPRLGGNKRVGVFATRSPFRPNPIGLSCVRLLGIEKTEQDGYVLRVAGADMVDGTPILDIKPYLPYTDCRPDAESGFAERVKDYALQVDIPPAWQEKIPPDKITVLKKILAQDPRPAYQKDEERIYGVTYGGMNVRFLVKGDVLTVVEIQGGDSTG